MSVTPVLFIVFNRIGTARRVFEAIRSYRPERLYIAADGPRADRPDDMAACAEVRAMAGEIDWPCTVSTLFREKNLGCKMGITTAIGWFFRQEPEGIILEDDCLPGPDFFPYCEDLLKRYRDDMRIMHIGGVNLQQGRQRGSGSYYFSHIPSIWGWAGWRRSWALYDIDMTLFPEFEYFNQMINIFPDERVAAWASRMARLAYEQKINTYDFQWAFTLIVRQGLAISPNINLVSNIGFLKNATHTTDPDDIHANIPFGELKVLRHPPFMIVDHEADLHQLSLSMPPPVPATEGRNGFPKKFIKRLLHAVHP